MKNGVKNIQTAGYNGARTINEREIQNEKALMKRTFVAQPKMC